MTDPTHRRRERLRRTSRTDGVDALLVASPTNVGYLTGFTGEAATLLVARDRNLILSDGRFATQLEQECPAIEAHIRPEGRTMVQAIADVVGKLGLRRLAFEAASLTVAEHGLLREGLPATELVGVDGRVEALRAVKDRGEIDEIRRAVDMAERAFAMLRSGLRPDDTEKAAADDLEAYLRRCGATSSSFPTIVAAGPHAARPHYRPDARARVGTSDFVLVDWGAAVRGYKSDLTRVLVTGKVTPKFEKVYRSVLAAQERGIAAIRPGVLAKDVDAEARSAIEEAGFGCFFRHSLGHGLGLEIHEAPWLRSTSDVPLRAGMVVTVEPGVYLPGWGGIRIEDDVLVTPDGGEVLSQVPRSLDSVKVGRGVDR
jgi:Xaa-Pro aminopeptidase